jgi:triosephosphate isomerase
MAQKIIIANWKMNPASKAEAENIMAGIVSGAQNKAAKVVICPPAVYLTTLKGLSLGAQNVHFEDKGAFTGEISAAMAKDAGAEYVIVGHSERRTLFGETDEMVNKKIKKTLEVGLKVIFCIGETAAERDAGKKQEVLKAQIAKGLSGVAFSENLIVAYEPVWAIGTGNSCSPQETKESLEFIRTLVKDAPVVYGGSANAANAKEYLTDAGADGLLVGGASLKPEEFSQMIAAAE